MKNKIIGGLLAALVLALSLFVLIVNRQQVQASTSHRVAIIGGFIGSQQTNHITIATSSEVRVGMRIFFRCSVPSSVVIRTVYPNHNANVLGRYTWQWQGTPCNTGSAVVIVVGSQSGQTFTTQKTFTIAPKIGVNGNPWGYDFAPGTFISSPPAAFCHYFRCIANFPNGTGYVVECTDLMYSLSGGNRGACSSHGGVYRPLYNHAGMTLPPVSPTPTSVLPTPTPVPPTPTP